MAMRPWYNKIIYSLNTSFYSYSGEKLVYYISIFIILLVLISLYYWIIWKKFEMEFIDSIKKSFDLINLIPEEIKNIIVTKLNEKI